MGDSADEQLRPDDRSAKIEGLLARIEAHETEEKAIADETKALGLTSRRITAIRAHKKTIAALMGLGLADDDGTILSGEPEGEQ